MTRAGVLVTNTPSSMPRPVATTALTFLLALAGKLFLKDRLTRSGRWHERMDNMGLGLTGRTLGVIGAGRIGRELMSMARTFDLKLLASRSAGRRDRARPTSVRARSPLDELLQQSDFRRRLLPALARNASSDRRGGPAQDAARSVSDQCRTRTGRRRAGADRGAAGVAASPARRSTYSSRNRSIRPIRCWRWTTSSSRRIRYAGPTNAFTTWRRPGSPSIVDALAGRKPQFVVNPEVLSHARVQAWLAR